MSQQFCQENELHLVCPTNEFSVDIISISEHDSALKPLLFDSRQVKGEGHKKCESRVSSQSFQSILIVSILSYWTDTKTVSTSFLFVKILEIILY